MDKHDLELVKKTLDEALKLPQANRLSFIADACGENEAVRQEVESLLHAAGKTDASFLESPAIPEMPSDMLIPASMTSNMPLSTLPTRGQFIGSYQIHEQLGEGGLSVVYMGLQESPIRREVAVKLLKAGIDSQLVLSRFKIEQELLTKLDHPNIAKAIDAGIDATSGPYFVIELVRGMPIDDFCESVQLGFTERIKLFLEACKGVHHAHMRGVIHRDLKPSNILVEDVDGTILPKIIDFGIAKAMSFPHQSNHTRHGFPLGTPAYMSPEQWSSELDIDVRTDVYSMGVLLFRLLTGAMPFDDHAKTSQENSPSAPSTKLKEMNTLGKSPYDNQETKTAFKALTKDLDWVILKSLSHDKQLRYASINELVADTHRFLRHEPITARRISRMGLMKKFCRRRQGLAAAMGASTICVVIIIAALAINLLAARRHSQQLEHAHQQSARHASIANKTVRFFTDDVLGQAAPGRLGPNATINDLILATSPAIDDRLGDTPELAARVHFELGLLFGLFGDDGRADIEFHRAKKKLRELKQHNAPFAAEIAAHHAVLLARTPNRHDDAKALIQGYLFSDHPSETLDLRNPEDANQFRLWDAMARIDELGANPHSGFVLRQSIMEAVERGGGFPTEQLWLEERSNYVSSLVRSGEYKAGIHEAESILRDAKRSKELRTIQRVKLMLAQVYRAAGRIDEACEMSDMAAEEATNLYGLSHPITIDSYMLSTFAHDVSERRDRAVVTAFAAYRGAIDSEHGSQRWAECGSVYARILLIANDDKQNAGIVADEILAGWIPGSPVPDYLNGLNTSTLSYTLRELDRIAEAEALLIGVLTNPNLYSQDRFLVLREIFHIHLKNAQIIDAESTLQKMDLIAATQIGHRKHVLHEAVLCAKADLLAANDQFEEAETTLLNEIENLQPYVNPTLIKNKLSDIYALWGYPEKAELWAVTHKSQINPIILDELLRKYVEHTRE